MFGSYWKGNAISAYVSGLRRTARVLGSVRDLDVLIHKADLYSASTPQGRAHDLSPVLFVWQEQRDQARVEMLKYLDTAKYADFVEDFYRFLRTPGAGVRWARRPCSPPPIACS